MQRVIQFEALEKINITSLQVITGIDHYVTFTVKNSIFFLNIKKNVKQKKLKMKATLSTISMIKYVHIVIFGG